MAGKMNLLVLLSVACIALDGIRGEGEGEIHRFDFASCMGSYPGFLYAGIDSNRNVNLQAICGEVAVLPPEVHHTSGLVDVKAELKCPGYQFSTERLGVDVGGIDQAWTGITVLSTLDDLTNMKHTSLCQLTVTVGTYQSWPQKVALFKQGQGSVSVLGHGSAEHVHTVGGTTWDQLPQGQLTVEHSGLSAVEGECVFAVAYLRPIGHEMVAEPCQSLDTISATEWTNAYYEFQFLEMSDIILGVKCLQSSDPVSVDVKDIIQEMPEISGQFHLVLQVDPVGTLALTDDRCDNVKSTRVDLGDTSAIHGEPMCQHIPNLFHPTASAFMIKGIYMEEDSQMAWRKLFYNDKPGKYEKSEAHIDEDHLLKMHGFGILKMFYSYIKHEKMSVCDAVTDVKMLLKENNGIIDADIEAVSVEKFTTAFGNKELSETELMTRLSTVMDTPSMTFQDKVDNNITRSVFKCLMQIKSEDTAMPMEHPTMGEHFHDMSLSDIIKTIVSEGKGMKGYDEGRLLHMVEKLTCINVKLQMKFPENTCFNKVYNTLMTFIRDIDTAPEELSDNTAALFDVEDLENLKSAAGLTNLKNENASDVEVNGCIRMIDLYLNNKCDMYEDMTPEIKNKFCLIKEVQRFLMDRKDFMKFFYVRSLMNKKDMEDMLKPENEKMKEKKKGYKDDLTVKKLTNAVWEQTDDDHFNMYAISPDLEKVCKRKMATCRCEECGVPMPDGTAGEPAGTEPADDPKL